MVWYLGKTKERKSVQTPLGKPYVVLPTLEAFSPSAAVGVESRNQIWGICSEWNLWLLYIYLMFKSDQHYKMYINDKYIGLCKCRIISFSVRKPHFQHPNSSLTLAEHSPPWQQTLDVDTKGPGIFKLRAWRLRTSILLLLDSGVFSWIALKSKKKKLPFWLAQLVKSSLSHGKYQKC